MITYQDHLKFYIKDDIFNVEFGRTQNLNLSWRQANKKSAEIIGEICKQKNKKIAVMFSGGMDSQIIIFSLFDAGVDFDIFHFFHEGNEFETNFVKNFEKYINKEIKYIPINLKEIFYSENYQYLRNFSIFTSFILHNYMIDYLSNKNYTILYGDLIKAFKLVDIDHTWDKIDNSKKWILGFNINDFIPMKFSAINNIDLILFFYFLPEQIYSMINSLWFENLINKKLNLVKVENNKIIDLGIPANWITIQNNKHILYMEQYSELLYVAKNTGTEGIRDKEFYNPFIRFKRPKEEINMNCFFDIDKLNLYFENKLDNINEAKVKLSKCYWFPELEL